MQVSQVIEQLKPRMQRLGLVDPVSGFYDPDEIVTYLMDAMRYLANRYQLQHFLNMNRELFRTVADVEFYPIPSNYGFIAPTESRRSGLAIKNSDGTAIANLEYYDPARYELIRSTTTGKPAWFTVAHNLLYFMPIPDTQYIVEAIERETQDGDEVPDAYVAIVKIETLWRLASDMGKATQLLADERAQLTRTLVNNESRFRQRFYTSYERPGIGRGRRRYGY